MNEQQKRAHSVSMLVGFGWTAAVALIINHLGTTPVAFFFIVLFSVLWALVGRYVVAVVRLFFP